MERSLLLFQNSLKSEKSFGTYFRNLNLFRRFIGSEDFDSITRTKSEKLQIFLEDYIMDLKGRDIKTAAAIIAIVKGQFLLLMFCILFCRVFELLDLIYRNYFLGRMRIKKG